MKKLLILTMVAVLGASVAFAKPPKAGVPQKAAMPNATVGKAGQPQKRGHFREELYAKLKLTATQKKKIEAIDAKYKKLFEALRAKRDPKGFEAMKGLMDKRNKEVTAILDKNQKKTYEAEMKKWQTMRRRGPGGPGGMGRPGGPGAGPGPAKKPPTTKKPTK